MPKKAYNCKVAGSINQKVPENRIIGQPRTVYMRKVMLILPIIMFCLHSICNATDHNGDEILKFISLTPYSVTQLKVSSILGEPASIEESNRRVWWYYNYGGAKLTISWNKKSESLEKFSFTSEQGVKGNFDRNLSAKLKSGTTDMVTALNILGTPINLTVRASTQEMHYAYLNKRLRLFFRDRKLVDFCLY